MLKNYDPNIRWGTHRLEVTLQQWNFKNTVTFEMGGNTKGISILESGLHEILDNVLIDNPGNLRRLVSENEEWFGVTLIDSNGEKMDVEDETMYFNDLVVGIRIIDFEEDKDE